MARRKGGLGRRLKVEPQCYAGRVLGGCFGKVSQEHPLSEGLRRGKTLQVIVSRQPPGEKAWQRTFSAEITARQASAPVLCEKHNGTLSPADAEALKLSEALRDAAARSHSPIIRPYSVVRVDGHLFGRWLCKFYSGCMAMTQQDVHPDFVRYAFGGTTTGRLYFLFPAEAGQIPRLGDTRNLSLQGYRTEVGGPEAFRVTFEGLDVVVSTVKGGPGMAEVFDELPFQHGTRIIDRLRALDLGDIQLRISLDWSSDPDEPWILGPTGMPTARRT